MSIVVRYSPISLTKEKYSDLMRRLKEAGVQLPADGLDYHVCFGSDGDLRVTEIWASREQLQAFGERLAPILAHAGIEFSAEPEILEAHDIIRKQ